MAGGAVEMVERLKVLLDVAKEAVVGCGRFCSMVRLLAGYLNGYHGFEQIVSDSRESTNPTSLALPSMGWLTARYH